MSYFTILILAMALPSLRIFPPLNRAWLVAMGILSIVLFKKSTIFYFQFLMGRRSSQKLGDIPQH